jgi:hypothetical protein
MNPLYVTTKGKGNISLRRISQTNSLQTMSFCNVLSSLRYKGVNMTGKISLILSYSSVPLSSRYCTFYFYSITFSSYSFSFVYSSSVIINKLLLLLFFSLFFRFLSFFPCSSFPCSFTFSSDCLLLPLFSFSILQYISFPLPPTPLLPLLLPQFLF